MTAKRAGLITDSYKVVKRSRREEKREKRAPSPPQKDAEPRPLTARDKELQELRQFDLDWRYGPCTGISRLQRWERAAQHGLNPLRRSEICCSAQTQTQTTHTACGVTIHCEK